MELKNITSIFYTSISQQLPADGRGPFAGSFLTCDTKFVELFFCIQLVNIKIIEKKQIN